MRIRALAKAAGEAAAAVAATRTLGNAQRALAGVEG